MIQKELQVPARIMAYFCPIQCGNQVMESAPNAAPTENKALIASRMESVCEERGPVSRRLKDV